MRGLGACGICGGPGADCLCLECGRLFCERCFSGGDLCVECARRAGIVAPAPRRPSSPGVSSSGLRVAGMLLIVFGLMVTSIAMMPEDGEGAIVLFPFVFGEISGGLAALLSVVFLGVFIVSSLLPWYMFNRRRREWSRFRTVEWEVRPHESEAMEYMITLEVPPELKRTVFIEGVGGEVRLGSSVDGSFSRSYDLPRGFEVDEYNYEYEGDYLVLRLKLKRAI
ncbi:hypothetical protein HQ586_02805 [Candidatus Bathyarchaeota archaeon]|nr:hypothetical protein [Candidatus Bathyarchaeota archaeon]